MSDIIQYNSLLTYGWIIALLAAAIIAAKLFQTFLVRIFHSKHIFRSELIHSITDEVQSPLLWLLTSIAVSAVIPLAQISVPWLADVSLWLRPISVGLFGWFIIGVAQGTGIWLETHYSTKKTRDNLSTRRFTTQIRILMRVVVSVIVVLTLVGMAMVVPALRQLGMSLFASAGVAGIVLGIAARESFSNLIAGVQLALTQQILLGDEVIVDNKFGTIEEITSSYVVVKTWDLKRLVVPLRYFMENSFENWTYHESDLFASVYLYTDYSVNISALRSEAERIVEDSKWWDGKRFDLVVTDSKENTLQIRITVSGRNSAEVWNLQCETREKLVAYLQETQPDALPKTRVELRQSSYAS
jgi:small-conductance mechanosensitive channel